MEKQMNNSRLHRWTSFLLVFVLIFGILAVPEKAYANPYSGGDSNCTYTAWRLAYANTGIQLPAWGNAGTWYNSARNAGYTVSTVPRAKSIAVWSGGPSGYGHVAYVTEVSGDQIYIQEGGYNGAYHEGWENAYGQTKYYSSNLLTMIGYIYLGDSAKVDLGESFYAFITNAYSNLDATAVGDDIKLKKEIGTGYQVFQFTRLSDGYYQILECGSKSSMDVYGASSEQRANVGTYAPNGSSAQKWYITGKDKYIIHAACTSCVLSAAWGGAADGTTVNMEYDAQQDWQRWYIRKLPGVGKTTVSAQVGQGKVTLSWTQASECNSYSLRIFKNGQDFHSEYGLKVLSRTVELEAGTYTAYVDSCNAYSFLKSNEVTFTVAETAGNTEKEHKLVTIPMTNATCTQPGWTQGEYCSVCGEVFVEQKEIPPTGHQGGTATCIAAAVCDICHEEYGDINSEIHENVQTQGARVKTCATDGYTGDVICCDCYEVLEQGTVLPADGHAWSAWRTIQQADCVNAGKRRRTCENCDETETKTIAALGHDIVTDKAVPATTSATGLTKGSHCGICGEVLQAQKKVPKLAKVTKPKAPTVKLTTKKKTVQVKITKVKGASGYEIYRSKSKSSGYKKITSTKKTSYTNKGLTAKKTYYYKVRAYKTSNGKKVYGNWSKVMKIKVKK